VAHFCVLLCAPPLVALYGEVLLDLSARALRRRHLLLQRRGLDVAAAGGRILGLCTRATLSGSS